MAVAPETAPVSAQLVGNAFVQQYYHILHHSPGLVCRFYQDGSNLGRPEDDGSMSITTTMKAINDKILSLNYSKFKAEIKYVDAQESYNGGVHVLVTGYLTGKDDLIHNFTQSFFLAPQDRGFFVLNDMFRYVESINQRDGDDSSVNDVVTPVPSEQSPPPVEDNHVAEQTTALEEGANGEEVCDPPGNGDVSPVDEEEVPVAEVVDEAQVDSYVIVEASLKTEEGPKKSYASIVMDSKGIDVPFSFPALAPRKSPSKSQEQVNPAPCLDSAAEVPVSNSNAVDDGNEEEADGYSIYMRGLPMNATAALLENEFKKFGPIKNNGIQVRNNRQHGFVFGFVEFEVASAMQKAVEASPITISGREIVVEEKRSTFQGNNGRGRFPPGRGFGFRNEGPRGRGNYGGGRGGYGRNDFIGRNEFGNRGSSNWGGGLANRGVDGYQRADNMEWWPQLPWR